MAAPPLSLNPKSLVSIDPLASDLANMLSLKVMLIESLLGKRLDLVINGRILSNSFTVLFF